VQRYFDNSLAYSSPQAEKLRAAVKKAGLTAVIGLSERDGGSLYIAQWLIGPDGETIAKRRKLRPTHVERSNLPHRIVCSAPPASLASSTASRIRAARS
jgi:aliphatic nitrilase